MKNEYLIINGKVTLEMPIGNRDKLISAISKYTPLDIGGYYTADQDNIHEFLEYHEGITSFIARTYFINEDKKWEEVDIVIAEGSRVQDYPELEKAIEEHKALNC